MFKRQTFTSHFGKQFKICPSGQAAGIPARFPRKHFGDYYSAETFVRGLRASSMQLQYLAQSVGCAGAAGPVAAIARGLIKGQLRAYPLTAKDLAFTAERVTRVVRHDSGLQFQFADPSVQLVCDSRDLKRFSSVTAARRFIKSLGLTEEQYSAVAVIAQETPAGAALGEETLAAALSEGKLVVIQRAPFSRPEVAAADPAGLPMKAAPGLGPVAETPPPNTAKSSGSRSAAQAKALVAAAASGVAFCEVCE